MLFRSNDTATTEIYTLSLHDALPIFLLIVEVADSSSDYDRNVKSRVYAEAGIGEYWLADLAENAVFVYSGPQGGAYVSLAQHHPGQSIAPQALPDAVVAVQMLLAGSVSENTTL